MRPSATAGRHVWDSHYLTEGRELDRARPLGIRARKALRRAALDVLARRPVEPRPGVRIVHYHYVFDDERESFARQLDFLTSAYEPVSLTEAVERLENGGVHGRELVVTFDDGFRNQRSNAAPLLAERGIRACFFLVSALVSAGREETERLCRERLHLPGPVEPMTWEDARELVELGHEVGSHTRSHQNLVGMAPDALADELGASREEIGRRLERPVVHFSAPYGESHRFSPAVSAAARAAGYASCATAQRGLNTKAADVFELRRDHIEASWPVAHVRHFLARS